LGDQPLAAWPARALAEVSPHCIQVGGEPLAALGWPCVPDEREAAGPAAGLEAALLYAPGAALVVCAVDVPFVPAGLLRYALA
ncbi:MAG: NTP transferase domain-containing protein, partial [Gammaproteobacteria bacterium]|nr:NTP transferase domain-containing protein [Gammaproteobacteria bacterium]